jgi:hypothetical protein
MILDDPTLIAECDALLAECEPVPADEMAKAQRTDWSFLPSWDGVLTRQVAA